MRQYTQLSQKERYEISRCFKSNKSKAQMARELNRSRSILCREINRNKGLRGYRPKQVHLLAQKRRIKIYIVLLHLLRHILPTYLRIVVVNL